MSSSTKDKYVAELDQLFKTQAAQLYSGQLSLCLTTSCLHFLQQKTAATQDDSRRTRDLKKLNDNFRKLNSLKLIPDKKRTVAPSLIRLNLSPFVALQTLVLKRVPVTTLTGLHKLREQLKELVIERSQVSSLELVLVQCGGDETSARVWSSLRELDLSINTIEALDESLRYLPVLEKLNLSNNQVGESQPPPSSAPASITSTITSSSSSSSSSDPSPTLTTVASSNHPEYLSGIQYLDKIRWLHLGFNMITCIPPFSEKAQYTLTSLILRNNRLTKIDGIEVLDTLKDLDLSENLLSRHLDLKPLKNLHHLAVLQLAGNPFVFDPKHRVKTVGFLSNLINPELFVLDGKKLNSAEKKALSRTMTHFLSTTTSSSSVQSLSYSPVPPPSIPIYAHPKNSTLPSPILSAPRQSPPLLVAGPSISKTRTGGHRRRAKERVVNLEDETVDHEEVVSSSSLNKSDSQNVPLLHEEKIQADQDLKKLLRDRWLVTGGTNRHNTSLDEEGSPVLPPAAVSGSQSPGSGGRRRKRKDKSLKSKSPHKSKLSSSPMISDEGSPVVQRSSQPDTEPSPETHSGAGTQPHSNGTRNGEMGSSTGSSGNGGQEKISEEQPKLGREWVNIETPHVDPVLSRMDDDAAAVGDQYIVEVFESDTEQEDEARGPDSVILLITDRFLQEIDINGRVIDQLDLHCLKQALVEERSVRGASCRVLVLHFGHERRDRRKREYVLSSDDDESAILDRLTPIATENSSANSIATKLECLKCQRAIDWSEALDPPSSAPQALFPSPLDKSKSLLNKLCPYCHKPFLIQVSTEAAASPATSSMMVPPSIKNSSPKTSRKLPTVASVTHEPVRKNDVRDSNSPSVLPHVDLSYSYPTSPEPNVDKTPPPSNRPTSPPPAAAAAAQQAHLDLSPFVDKPQSNWPVTQPQRTREEEQVDGAQGLRGSTQAVGIDSYDGVEGNRSLNPFDDEEDDYESPYYPHLPASEPRPSTTRYPIRTSPVSIHSSPSQNRQSDTVPSSVPSSTRRREGEREVREDVTRNQRSARRELVYNEPDPFTTNPDPVASSSVPSDNLWNSLASIGRKASKKKQKDSLPVPHSSKSTHSRSHSVDLKKPAPSSGLEKRQSSASKVHRGSQASIDSFSSDQGGRGGHDETSSGAEKHGSSGSGGEKKSSSGSSRLRRFINGRRSNNSRNSSGDVVDKRPASPVIPYKEDDPSYIHSTFNVYLDMEVFNTEKNEQFQLAMKCPVVEYGELGETESFLIISNLNAYVYRVTAPESLQPTTWLDLKAMLPLRSLVFITIGIGYQWLRLEFGPEASSAQCFTFLIRNEDKCRAVFQKLSFVVSDVPRSLLKNIGVSQFSMTDISNPDKALRLAVMAHYDHVEPYQDPPSPTSPGSDRECDEQLKMYLLAYQYHQGQEPAQVPVTLVLTNCHLYLAIQNHQWPLPKLHPQPSRSDLLPPFSGVIRKNINDIEQIILYDDQNCNFTLHFFSEGLCHEEESWTIILRTSKTVMALVTKIKDIWEQELEQEFSFTYK